MRLKETEAYKAVSAEYARVWGEGTSMHEWSMKGISSIVELEGGNYFVFRNQKIETSFPVGENAYTDKEWKEAQDTVHRLNTDERLFKRNNMDAWDSAFKFGGVYILKNYTGCGEIHVVDYFREAESYGYYDNAAKVYVPSKKDMKALLAQRKVEREKFEKRIDTYLKRYGMSKVRSWSYWTER